MNNAMMMADAAVVNFMNDVGSDGWYVKVV